MWRLKGECYEQPKSRSFLYFVCFASAANEALIGCTYLYYIGVPPVEIWEFLPGSLKEVSIEQVRWGRYCLGESCVLVMGKVGNKTNEHFIACHEIGIGISRFAIFYICFIYLEPFLDVRSPPPVTLWVL